jgi:acyl-homoserine lactone acylase PvdQ
MVKSGIFLVLLTLCIAFPSLGQPFRPAEIGKWKVQAKRVIITRDTWGIAHVKGKSDADAIFGMMFAQCEDDFARVERNYINALGRMAEAEGESFLYNDLRMRLFQDSSSAIALYPTIPVWMKAVCQAFSDGINYYLYTHPMVKPKLIKRFQPWMPLLFSEGSIGGDIEGVPLNDIREFYGKEKAVETVESFEDGNGPEPKGSNGIAIAPALSQSGNAMLLINPHTSFYFRSEIGVTSDEGLNVYGAVTWGQFFIYQGFNEHCGWMHTTSQADVVDYYLEKIIRKKKELFYQYGTESRAVSSKDIVIRYKSAQGLGSRTFKTYYTSHGPIVSQKGKQWVSVRLMIEPVKALMQSYQRTRAVTFNDFKTVMDLRANSSNNTVYADDQGNIAYWHGDYVPKRDTTFDWSKPVDGSNPATDWKELHEVNDIVHMFNPAKGWIQNCNSTPFTVSGPGSLDRKKYPRYMAPDQENMRGLHAVKVLEPIKEATLDKLIATSQDTYLPAFPMIIPSLISAFDEYQSTDSIKSKLGEPVSVLRNWDFRYHTGSVATTLGIFWAQQMLTSVRTRIPAGLDQAQTMQYLATQTTAMEKLKSLSAAIAELTRDYGKWNLGWGEINRFQRLSGQIESVFDDQKQSIPVAYTSSYWGSLAAYGSRKYPGTKKLYGGVGNSFVAVVEFGKRVKARSVVTGGSSSDPQSSHFNDQSLLYTTGQFKEVWFYPEDYKAHAEATYSPGLR